MDYAHLLVLVFQANGSISRMQTPVRMEGLEWLPAALLTMWCFSSSVDVRALLLQCKLASCHFLRGSLRRSIREKKPTCWKLSLRWPWSSGWQNSRIPLPSRSCVGRECTVIREERHHWVRKGRRLGHPIIPGGEGGPQLAWGWYPTTLMQRGSTKVVTPSKLCRERNSVGTRSPLVSTVTGELVTWEDSVT